MTDPYTGARTDDLVAADEPTLADIVEDADPRTASLDRQADAILSQAEGRAFGPTTSVRQAMREDLGEGRAWASARAHRTADAIRDEPIKATAYALGVGVLIGLLLRR